MAGVNVPSWGSCPGPHGYPSVVHNWPHLSLDAALWRAGPVPCPDSPEDLALVTEVWVSQAQGVSVGEVSL